MHGLCVIAVFSLLHSQVALLQPIRILTSSTLITATVLLMPSMTALIWVASMTRAVKLEREALPLIWRSRLTATWGSQNVQTVAWGGSSLLMERSVPPPVPSRVSYTLKMDLTSTFIGPQSLQAYVRRLALVLLLMVYINCMLRLDCVMDLSTPTMLTLDLPPLLTWPLRKSLLLVSGLY